MIKLRRKERRKNKNERYTILDFIVDVLFWIPELLFLPFRLLFIGGRYLFRLFSDF
ncbi:hypothetical protein [Sporosarcina sp. ANT_H38]|uniref:hypothetical protein n=1 Tax=Sporosarcina sp. ANT_H38 TaxID=2597358 RepID=UPI00165D5142|nr:hypothetical protein [Sporosarcina sp. ANT_H38]